MSGRKYKRLGECNRRYECAKLNCCGDCDELENREGIGYCKLEANKPETCKRSPTSTHWDQGAYWGRGIDCSYTFEEVRGAF